MSDHRSVRDHGVLGDDDDPVADVVAVAVLLRGPRLVHDADPPSDAGVLVDDRALDHGVGPDPQGGHAARVRPLDLVDGLVVVGPQHEGGALARSLPEATPDADQCTVDIYLEHAREHPYYVRCMCSNP